MQSSNWIISKKLHIFEISRYASPDKNLIHTELCEIKLECKDLEGKPVKSSTVYFNIGEKGISTTVQKLENCHGKIVIGNLDDQCAGTNGGEAIKNRAETHGKSGKFKSN